MTEPPASRRVVARAYGQQVAARVSADGFSASLAYATAGHVVGVEGVIAGRVADLALEFGQDCDVLFSQITGWLESVSSADSRFDARWGISVATAVVRAEAVSVRLAGDLFSLWCGGLWLMGDPPYDARSPGRGFELCSWDPGGHIHAATTMAADVRDAFTRRLFVSNGANFRRREVEALLVGGNQDQAVERLDGHFRAGTPDTAFILFG